MTLIPLLALWAFLRLTSAISVSPSSLRANAQSNPIAIDTATPRLTWRLTSPTRGDNQTAYQIQASSSSSFDAALWDSGKTPSADPWAIYAGDTLSSRYSVFWRVKVWGVDNVASEWSDVASFEVSLLDKDDWSAEWITNKDFSTGLTSLPRFARLFTVSCPVEKARLYIMGLGLHHPLLNEEKVGDDVLSPGYATLNKTMPYSTHDVLDQLLQGRNVLAVELGKGIYDNTAPLLGRYTKFKQAPRELMLLAQLEYVCDDGTTHVIATDESWRTTVEGPWVEAHWYGGEEYEARKEVPGWAGACHDRSGWRNASIAIPPAGKLVSPRSPALKVTESITAKSVRQVRFPLLSLVKRWLM
ncbi:alpha-l-rhamnosidase [Colletotrichum musicola]|uniref:Alpha-l-rhamnosidase n=1 Tax=Colletotrichum musicola TaxID=2175873 RepID=A0A8H6J0E2_9PEZI|nr:alpha-l-rhamnosidase [Colletotrichum musicola]